MDYNSKKRISAVPVAFAAVMLFAFFGCNDNPGDREYNRALKLWERGKLVRARASLEKAINKRAGSPKNAVAYNQLGAILWDLNEPQKAQQAFNDSRKLNPQRFDACYNLGAVLCWGGQLSEAREVLREAAMINPQDGRALEVLASAYLKARDWKGAGVELGEASRRNPDSPRIQTAQAIVELHSSEGSPVAIRRLKSVIESHPNYAPAFFNMGAIYQHWLKDRANAEKFLEGYLRLAPDGPMAEMAGEMIRELRGEAPRVSTARSASTSAPSSVLRFNRPAKPNRPAAVEAFGEGFKHQLATDLKRAIDAYIKAIEFDDTYADAFYNLGLCYTGVQQLDKACAAYGFAVELNPGNNDARYALAYGYYQLKRYDDAKAQLQMILTADPDDSKAVNLMTLVSGRIQ
jgi:tetratricopeptide (TPR) repeat protein